MPSDIFIPGDAIKFQCPSCKLARPLEVVSAHAVITQVVTSIDTWYDDDAYFEVGPDVLVHDAEVKRFQCNVCGYVVAENTEQLKKWYEKQDGIQDGR